MLPKYDSRVCISLSIWLSRASFTYNTAVTTLSFIIPDRFDLLKQHTILVGADLFCYHRYLTGHLLGWLRGEAQHQPGWINLNFKRL